MEQQALQEHKEPQAQQELLVQQVQQVQQEIPEPQVPQEHLVQME